MSDKTIWVVEQGSYSDYRVVGVFTSETAAKRIAAAINASDERYYDEATVDEWPLDPGIEELNQGLHIYFVQMQEDGTVDRCERRSFGAYDLSEVSEGPQMWRRSTAPAYIGQGIKDVLWATVWASDETHAVKIANEHRTRMIATGAWHAAQPETK